MKPLLTALKRERASDSVYQTLRECILSQQFQPGERLHVKELAATLGVSLTPVKDAINRLAIEGLVAINPRSGTYVTEISSRDLAETFELRVALECLAAELCVERIEEGELADLEKLVQALNTTVRTDRERKLHEERNHEFHKQIVRIAGNRRLMDMYNSLNAHIQIARVHYSREGWEQRIEQERAEHNEIFKALKRRDAARLVRLLRTHIERAADSLIRDLERTGTSTHDPASAEAAAMEVKAGI